MRTVCLLLLMLGLTASVGVAQRTLAGVARAVEELRLAMLAPTEARLSALIADSLSYGHSNGLVEDKTTFMHALTSGDSGFKSMTLTGQQISVTDKVAVVRHVLQGETINKGVAGTANLAVLQVWLYQRGSWKLLARQAVKRQ